MIIKALTYEPNYSIIINDKKGQISCSFSYNTEMIDIEETIIFTKINTAQTKELLLIERIKELTELATPVFGYGDFGEIMIFKIDSNVIDFRPFDDFIRYPNFYDYNKITKAKKIIMSTGSSVHCVSVKHGFNFSNITYTCGCTTTATYKCSYPGHGMTYCSNWTCNIIESKLHFNHPSVFLPSVTEVEIFCSPYTKLEEDYTKFGSLPNLEKLSLIHQDNTGFAGPFLDIHSMITTSINKKLKHIILKNISTWIKPDTVDNAKLFCTVNHIRLEII